MVIRHLQCSDAVTHQQVREPGGIGPMAFGGRFRISHFDTVVSGLLGKIPATKERKDHSAAMLQGFLLRMPRITRIKTAAQESIRANS
jgi:hypothetical protein